MVRNKFTFRRRPCSIRIGVSLCMTKHTLRSIWPRWFATLSLSFSHPPKYLYLAQSGVIDPNGPDMFDEPKQKKAKRKRAGRKRNDLMRVTEETQVDLNELGVD